METGDGDDLIVLNPDWLLSDVLGALFSEDTIRQARVTGSFTADDLHFLQFPEFDDTDTHIRLLTALECCTACLVQRHTDTPQPRHEDFFEHAANGFSGTHSFGGCPDGHELQLEIPRLNLVP